MHNDGRECKFHRKLQKLQDIKDLKMHFFHQGRHVKHLTTLGKLRKVPGATQALEKLLGNGASQRIFRKFIESSYVTLDPK